MILKWGTYAHDDGEVAAEIAVEPLRSEGNQFYAYRAVWTLNGMKVSDTQANLVIAIAALEAAYAVENKDLVLYQNDGITPAASLRTATSIGGTRVTGSPSYPRDGSADAEFSTFRHYRIQVEALYAIGNIQLLAWTEAINFHGTGGPRNIHRQPLVGLPQKQQVAQFTPVRLTQQGRAVGFRDWPTPPPPKWPADVKEDEVEIIYSSPKKRYGPTGNPQYVEFEVSWNYPFEGVGPFAGRPNLWPG